MKKLAVVLFAFACSALISCRQNDSKINITYNESDRYYAMIAHFGKSKTRYVERYMDRRLGRKSNISFMNAQIDGNITLDDDARFYLKKEPGLIKIKLNKTSNSDEAYVRVKAMCQGIKKVVTHR